MKPLQVAAGISQKVNLLLRLVDHNHRTVNGTIGVVAPLELFVVLPVQFITPALFWTNAISYCRRRRGSAGSPFTLTKS